MTSGQHWTVTLTKHRATWCYYTRNPQGGGFGSNYCGPQRLALLRAVQSIPAGTLYHLYINGKDHGTLTRA